MVDSIQLLRNIGQFDSVKRSGQSSSIDPWDVHQDCIAEHDKRHALIQHYIETGNSGKERDVATALYYVLEAFLRGSYPAIFRLENCLVNSTYSRVNLP